MDKKTVLIVTYYWPPAGGPGVQRPYYFAKYLKELGWDVVVYTVENNLQLGFDNSFEELININVYKTKISFQPKNVTGKSFVDSTGILNRFKKWIRGNLLIPDSKLFWLFQSKKALKKIFQEHQIDICFVTGPPQTTHLVGSQIKKLVQIPVIHDFRDPWTKSYFLTDFPRLELANWIDKKLEKNVIEKADAIVTVSNSLKKILVPEGKKNLVITNGYDSQISSAKKSGSKRMIYTGTLAESQFSKHFLHSISKFNIQLDFFGHIHKKVHEFVDSKHLQDQVKFNDLVNHSELNQILSDADYFLLLIPNVKHNDGIITGKLFEYLAANRPIFAIGPTDGDCAAILEKSGIGKMYNFNSDFNQNFKDFMKLDFQMDQTYVEQFSRKSLTTKLSDFMKTLL